MVTTCAIAHMLSHRLAHRLVGSALGENSPRYLPSVEGDGAAQRIARRAEARAALARHAAMQRLRLAFLVAMGAAVIAWVWMLLDQDAARELAWHNDQH